ncbi:hypothetical protein ACA910_000238 [Epithemia clementina (nom. ined.)]
MVPPLAASPENEDSVNTKSSLSYEETDAATKGVVSLLTSLVNSVMAPFNKPGVDNICIGNNPALESLTQFSPRSPQELLERIRTDYTERNYLWTGNIDLACFDEDCRFKDPTLSFVGRNQFVQNVQNLQPIVAAIVSQEQSLLLDIQLNEQQGYVQTRWNMVGEFTGLFWKPRLDVVGRTKFWFNSSDTNGSPDLSYSVYFYDEEWEIPAYRALLQLFVPAK